MAASAWLVHDRFKEYKGDNTIDMDNDVFEMRLYTSLSNVGTASVGDASLATNEVVGNGYAAQPVGISAGAGWTRAGGVVTFDVNDAVFTAVGGSIVARFAAIVDTSVVPPEVVASSQLDAVDVVATATNTLTVQIAATGVFTEQ